MAGRYPKRGMDYAGWSVAIFDNNTTIDELLDAQGWYGFAVYFYLCQRAYGSEGYYYKWCYDNSASTARKMGCGISAGTVRETVGYCLQIGLFDQRLFDKWGILTSVEIQTRYWEVLKTRDVKKVISEYWLLQDRECKGLLKLPLNSDLSIENSYFDTGNNNSSARNIDFHTQKESKGKESKVKGSKSPPALAEIEAYCAQQGYQYIDPKKFYLHYESTGWRNMHNWQASVDKWEIEDRERAQKVKPAGNNRFNNFQQRTYTQDELDRLMIRG